MDQQNVPQTQSVYSPVSIGEWIVTFILMYIPIVGIIMLFVWAFGDGTHPSKKTFAQAALIMALIFIVLWIVLIVVIGFSFGSLFSGYDASGWE